MNYLTQAKDWALQSLVYNHAEMQRMMRGVIAGGYGLDVAQYSKPFPGTQNTTTINVMGVGDGSPVPAPTPTVAPPASPTTTAPATVPAVPAVVTAAGTAPSLLTGRNAAIAALAASLLSGGTLAGWLAGRPSTATVPAVVAPAAPPQGWRVRVNWTDADGKPQQQVSPIEPIDPAK